MPGPPWDFSESDVSFDNAGFTFDGGVPPPVGVVNPFAFGESSFGFGSFGPAPTPPVPPQPPPLTPAVRPSSIDHLTWLLDWETGDSCLDANGDIAVASAPYSISQDVATQLSTFLGECWYDTTQGVPYWQQILGKRPTASLIASLLEAQALLVPDVATATATIGGLNAKRGAIGQMIVTDTDGIPTILPL